MKARQGQRSRSRTCLSCQTEESSEPLVETESCFPEESIWHGETELATVSNNAGIWNNEYPRFALENIFDDDQTTIWVSHNDFKADIKIITIDLEVGLKCKRFYSL